MKEAQDSSGLGWKRSSPHLPCSLQRTHGRAKARPELETRPPGSWCSAPAAAWPAGQWNAPSPHPGVPSVAQGDRSCLGRAGTQVPSPAGHSRLRIQRRRSCGLGCNCLSDLIHGWGIAYGTAAKKKKISSSWRSRSTDCIWARGLVQEASTWKHHRSQHSTSKPCFQPTQVIPPPTRWPWNLSGSVPIPLPPSYSPCDMRRP